MDSVEARPTTVCHVVAMPYPGRGHINPMMNLCKSLVSKLDNILVTFVVTEEWLGFIGSEPKPDKIQFSTVPNILPSELVRGSKMDEFIEALVTKMEAPFERLLDRLELPANIIMADTFLAWAVSVGNRRNIPVASFWPQSASVFSMFYHVDILEKNGHYPIDLSGKGDERVDYIPGISSTRLVDLPSFINGSKQNMMNVVLEIFSWVPKVQFLIITTIYELEPEVTDALKAKLPFPIYDIGLAIPQFKLGNNSFTSTNNHNGLNYLQWLDCQPNSSVLYISLGSFLSVSSTQMDEIAVGLCHSGVRFLWVARGEAARLREGCGKNGLVVPWCDQLRVLSHSSIGGFWTHCGWNSVKEGVFAGVPFLTLPLVIDQMPNSKQIVEDWKIGWRVKKEVRGDNLVTREEIAELVKKFMDLESNERKEMTARAKKLQQICQHAIAEDGSCETNIDSFVRNISH